MLTTIESYSHALSHTHTHIRTNTHLVIEFVIVILELRQVPYHVPVFVIRPQHAHDCVNVVAPIGLRGEEESGGKRRKVRAEREIDV